MSVIRYAPIGDSITFSLHESNGETQILNNDEESVSFVVKGKRKRVLQKRLTFFRLA
ncbi:hypothetical protein [Bacillus licheniformis]|uniref:hypothetical protein n=1 Tax=Bacillus licheniformis TaxID=1402 RepID=UPI001646BB2E|nr:hypothetical protein [Bacillus licheniformis]